MGGFGKRPGRPRVDRIYPVKIISRHIHQSAGGNDAGVAHHRIDTAHMGNGGGSNYITAIGSRKICYAGCCGRTNAIGYRLQSFRIAIGEQQLVWSRNNGTRGQLFSYGTSNPARGSGYDDTHMQFLNRQDQVQPSAAAEA